MSDITHLLGSIESSSEDFSQILSSHKLTPADYTEICKVLGRAPNLIELGIFSAMWSEHCSYKSSKKYLSGFPTKAPYVVQGPGENAGVIDIGDNLCAVFKIESHNHPSFLEPHAGAATGVGGIMRDIFTMGARPVASLNSIRFGDVNDKGALGKKHRYLLRGVVEGIGSYGNCMGVPTIGGEMSFEPCYNGNILVNAFCLGLAKKDEIFYGRAEGVGNPVIYVGSKTGRDGLGGAVMSSGSFEKGAKALRSAVQVGDPFAEKLLLEACLELFKRDLIVGIQDMGAAGLTSSSFEMAGRSGSGMILHLDKVPMREEGMNPYELMLSESQERMLICAKKGCEREVLEIFEKWELDAAIIGEVTKSGIMELFWGEVACARIPIAELSENAPMLDMPRDPAPVSNERIDSLQTSLSAQEIFSALLQSVEVADKSWVYQQYDSSVQSNTMTQAGSGDSSLIRIKGSERALSMSVDCNPRYCELNPREGAKIAVATSGRNSIVRGSKPLAITDCLNFGSPHNPRVMWSFSEVCEGIKEACIALGTPVVSGNVSLHNQSDGADIYPTPSIVSVGLLENASKALPTHFQKAGNALVLLGELKAELGGSLAQKLLEGRIYGAIPTIDLKRERALWECLLEANALSLLAAAKDIGEGGLAITLAKMSLTRALELRARGCLDSQGLESDSKNCSSAQGRALDCDSLARYAPTLLGCQVASGFKSGRDSHALFAPAQSCVILEIAHQNLGALQNLATRYELPLRELGSVGGNRLIIDEIDCPLEKAAELYFESFGAMIEQDL